VVVSQGGYLIYFNRIFKLILSIIVIIIIDNS